MMAISATRPFKSKTITTNALQGTEATSKTEQPISDLSHSDSSADAASPGHKENQSKASINDSTPTVDFDFVDSAKVVINLNTESEKLFHIIEHYLKSHSGNLVQVHQQFHNNGVDLCLSAATANTANHETQPEPQSDLASTNIIADFDVADVVPEPTTGEEVTDTPVQTEKMRVRVNNNSGERWYE